MEQIQDKLVLSLHSKTFIAHFVKVESILQDFTNFGQASVCVSTMRIFGRAPVSGANPARKVSVGRYSADTPNNPRQASLERLKTSFSTTAIFVTMLPLHTI